MKDWFYMLPNEKIGPRYAEAIRLAAEIENAYKKHKVPIKIPPKNYDPIYGDGFKFRVDPKKDTSVEKFEKLVLTVQYDLKLPFLQAVRENGKLYLITSPSNSLSVNNDLKLLLECPGYKKDFKKMQIVHPVGIDQNGNPIVCDLVEYPHVMVSGTTRSGKSTSLKCLLVSLLQYPSKYINILIADRGSDLAVFKNAPHLSCPIIRDPETLENVLLILKEEMERRNQLIFSDKANLKKLPYIVCVIDEFAWFIDEISNNTKSEKVIKAVSDILRFGRHSKIHLVLSIHDPKQDIAKIELGDIRVRLVFQTVNARKSSTAFGAGGAESLDGCGEMIFHHVNKQHRLKGFYMNDRKIRSEILKSIQNSFEENILNTYKFIISDEDLQKKKEAGSNHIIDSYSEQATYRKQDDDNQKFAGIVLWALTQQSVSISAIQKRFSAGFDRAKSIHEKLLEYKIIGKSSAKQAQKVLPKSVEDIPTELRTFLSKYVSEDDIENAINRRIINEQ